MMCVPNNKVLRTHSLRFSFPVPPPPPASANRHAFLLLPLQLRLPSGVSPSSVLPSQANPSSSSQTTASACSFLTSSASNRLCKPLLDLLETCSRDKLLLVLSELVILDQLMQE